MDLQKELETPGLFRLDSLFSKDTLPEFEQGLETLLTRAQADYQALLSLDAQSATFDATFRALQELDLKLSAGFQILEHFNAVEHRNETQAIIDRFQPKLVQFGTTVSMSQPLYRLLKAATASKADTWTAAQKRSAALLIRDMELSGVHLEGDAKKQVEDTQLRLSFLSEKISQNILKSRQEFFRHFADNTCLKEVPSQDLHQAKLEAQKRGLEGFVFTLSAPSYTAILRYCSDSAVRKDFYEAHHSIASSGEYDNRPLILETLQLRHQLARALGYANYAEYKLAARMIGSLSKVRDVLRLFTERALTAAKGELKELQTFAGNNDLKAWDLTYTAEKLSEQKFQIDNKELRKYFPVESTLQALFSIVNKLYGLTFKELKIPSYHPDVKSFEIKDGSECIAYFVLDLYTRPEKRGGAWCNTLRTPFLNLSGERVIPIITNVCNASPGSNTEPALLPHGEVTTLFHEFGHALHAMLSRNEYPNLHSFQVEWDFVELPSQIFENWVWHPNSLKLIAKHYQTGANLPEEWISKLTAKRQFMMGVFTLRQNEFGLLDIELHSLPEPPKSVEELDRLCFELSNRYTLLPKTERYKMYAAFSHIFSGGYGAGYYSYLWAEMLEADAFAEFEQNGVLNPETGSKFKKSVLEAGTSKPGIELFRDFTGREPSPEPLLRKKGI